MAANYLHGVETILLESGPRTVQVVKTAVIGLIGIAPIGPTNQPILVSGERDAAQFGVQLPGFNIPRSLSHIFSQGAGTVIVVNVFNPATHTTQVTDEVKVVANGKLSLSAAPIGAITIKNNNDTPATIINGTDYSIDSFGNFSALNATIVNGTSYKFSFKKLNPESVIPAHLVGTVEPSSGARTGMKCWELSRNLFGFNPKILIAPDYSALTAVASELTIQADRFRSLIILDAPFGTTPTGAIAGRGITGTFSFRTSSKRAILAYPYLKAYDPASNADVNYPFSPFWAGVMAATDIRDGYWFSPSNKEIRGIVGVERNITAGLNDPTSEANLLNESGICTVFNSFGTGIRTWGNRNASWPTNTSPDNFIPVIRTADVIHESLELAVLQFIDRPITSALIDAIRETGNSFIRSLVARGALIVGSRVEFPHEHNTPTDIAAGHLTYDLIMMMPVPGERITFRSFIDISLLTALIIN